MTKQFLIARFKAFIISFILVFVLVFLQKLGVKAPKAFQTGLNCLIHGFAKGCKVALVSPQSHLDPGFDNILIKLSQKKNNFSLNQPFQLISEAKAAGDYDQASSYVVLDGDSGQVLLQKNMQQQTPIASLTKIMSAVVALDLSSPGEEITVTNSDTWPEPSKIFIQPGQKLTVEELLNAMLLSSANDTAEALKNGIDTKYGGEVFVKAMNAKAQVIGLKNSHFANPMGFDNSSHYSSAEDLAILTHYALNNYPLIREIVSKPDADLAASSNHPDFYLNNWNGLLGVYPGAYGVKIGNTGWAHHTTIVASQRSGKNVLVVLLGAPGVLERDLWAGELLDVGFEKLSGLPPINISEYQLRQKYASWHY